MYNQLSLHYPIPTSVSVSRYFENHLTDTNNRLNRTGNQFFFLPSEILAIARLKKLRQTPFCSKNSFCEEKKRKVLLFFWISYH